MTKRHEITVEDFEMSHNLQQLASASLLVGTIRFRKILYFVTFAADPLKFSYEVEYQNEVKSYHTLEKAVEAYNKIN